MFKTLLATAALASIAPAIAAPVSITSTSSVYSQNFDSLTTTAATNVAWTNDSTLDAWSLFTGTGAAITTYGADNGGSNTGLFRSYGATGSSERALGSLASGGAYFGSPGTGAVAGYIALALSNSTGAALSSFTLAYDGEQWRNGGNATTPNQSLTFQYGYGASFAAVTAWTDVASLAFNAPVTSGTVGAAIDGNSTGLTANINGTVSTTWASGDTLWVRWTDLNDQGNDHGLAIDNLSLSVAAVPEPETYALMMAGLGIVGFMAKRRKI